MLPSRESDPQEQELGKRGRRRRERHQSLQADKAVSWSGPHQCAEWSRHLVCNYEEYMNVYRIEMGRKKWKPQLLPKYSWGESNWNNSRRKLHDKKRSFWSSIQFSDFSALTQIKAKMGDFLGCWVHGDVLLSLGGSHTAMCYFPRVLHAVYYCLLYIVNFYSLNG